MRKLIIQIPCFNEEHTLGATLDALPRTVPGFDAVEWLVIDDGSDDGTLAVADAYMVDHVVRLPKNQGLAAAFEAGIDACLRLQADVIVNTDGDNQYCAGDIPRLVAPILRREADIVIGTRPIKDIRQFSPLKRLLQRVGSSVVRFASGTEVPDATSGFRAYSSEAAKRLTQIDDYTHTLDTIIQAGRKRMAVEYVPVRVNEQLRPSRLFRSSGGYIWRTLPMILRGLVTRGPYYFFAIPGGVMLLLGVGLLLRFTYFFFALENTGHIQSLVVAAMLINTGCFLITIGLLADLVAGNRKLIEKINYRLNAVHALLNSPQAERRSAEVERSPVFTDI